MFRRTRTRNYCVRFNLLPYDQYKDEYSVTPADVLAIIEQGIKSKKRKEEYVGGELDEEAEKMKKKEEEKEKKMSFSFLKRLVCAVFKVTKESAKEGLVALFVLLGPTYASFCAFVLFLDTFLVKNTYRTLGFVSK